jgi:Domain of unknown function (DUF397)
MSDLDLSRVVWRKSIRSQQNGACVEIADLDRAIAIRDSKNPHGPKLLFSREAWRTFSMGIGQGSFDLR